MDLDPTALNVLYTSRTIDHQLGAYTVDHRIRCALDTSRMPIRRCCPGSRRDYWRVMFPRHHCMYCTATITITITTFICFISCLWLSDDNREIKHWCFLRSARILHASRSFCPFSRTISNPRDDNSTTLDIETHLTIRNNQCKKDNKAKDEFHSSAIALVINPSKLNSAVFLILVMSSISDEKIISSSPFMFLFLSNKPSMEYGC